MKVFITGATGYIGFNVAKKFRANGHIVYDLQEVRTIKTNYSEKKSFR